MRLRDDALEEGVQRGKHCVNDTTRREVSLSFAAATRSFRGAARAQVARENKRTLHRGGEGGSGRRACGGGLWGLEAAALGWRVAGQGQGAVGPDHVKAGPGLVLGGTMPQRRADQELGVPARQRCAAPSNRLRSALHPFPPRAPLVAATADSASQPARRHAPVDVRALGPLACARTGGAGVDGAAQGVDTFRGTCTAAPRVGAAPVGVWAVPPPADALESR